MQLSQLRRLLRKLPMSSVTSIQLSRFIMLNALTNASGAVQDVCPRSAGMRLQVPLRLTQICSVVGVSIEGVLFHKPSLRPESTWQQQSLENNGVIALGI